MLSLSAMINQGSYLKLLMKKIVLPSLMLLTCVVMQAQDKEQSVNQLVIIANHPGPVISKDIYGHFSEHLGACIYGGLWVGRDSRIPNTDGR